MKCWILIFVALQHISYAQEFTIKINNQQFRIHEILSQYIQQKSISGNEKSAGEWLKKLCEENDLYITQMGNSNGNYNFSASIRPLSDHLPNIIFLNHIDVVPVGDSSKWIYPPFSGMIMDGRVWGRGAFDNKGAAVVQLASVIQSGIHFSGKNLPFNVTFLAVSCEETQCQGGVSYVIENHFDELNPTVVIGEGELDEAPMLYIGEKVGTGNGPKVDIALDPLEGTTLTAKGQSDALTTIAMAEKGSLLNAADVYMDKIAIGPGCQNDVVHLDEDPDVNVKAYSKATKKPIELVTVCVLDRPRHADLIESIRSSGARVKLIPDGDIAGVIHTTDPQTGIDMYMGIGGAPEGVLAAAALRCTGGQMQAKLVLEDQEKKDRASKMGISDYDKIYSLNELVSGDALFAATGVTNGSMLSGIENNNGLWTNTVVMRSSSGTVRWIKSHHTNKEKFNL